MHAKFALVLIFSAIGLTTAGCGVTEKVRPYRLDVRQGNLITQEMISQLKKGMTRDQVRFALGTPLLTDPFHADRWDYVYRFKPGYGEAEERVITVHFEGDQLVQVSGDVTAATGEGVAPQRRIRELDLGAPAAAEAKEQ
jgi:outer membrane protein assembly factor BamE